MARSNMHLIAPPILALEAGDCQTYRKTTDRGDYKPARNWSNRSLTHNSG
ncbi:MAG: hypothetical protein JWQ22_3189 [Devosia sp.]|nr:hypothetical protein [Devosia sp.]